MILSRYFHDLHGSYQAEIEDLRYDSEGKDVLQTRLAQKRRELSSIMPLIDVDPVMVATAFHGAFDFEPAAGVGIADWAEPMIEQALDQELGQDFISTVLGLEYALSRYNDPYHQEEAQDGDDDAPDEHEAPGDEVRIDDYLEQHGFDRRSEG